MLFQIGGRSVEVLVLHNSTIIESGPEGFDVTPKEGVRNRLSLRASLPGTLSAFRVVDREKNVRSLSVGDGVADVPISTGYTPDNVWVSYYPNNGFRLLDLSGNSLKIWEVTLVRQGAKFYLVAQAVYVVDVFRSEEKVVCPAFERADRSWPQLVTLIGEVYGQVDLPALPEGYSVPTIERPIITEKYTGWVEWYNLAMGLGVIQTSQGPARVHWTAITQPNGGGFSSLESGMMVRFNTLGPSGAGRHGSAIPSQAYGVSPII